MWFILKQINIYLCFIDYTKVFDCVDHKDCGKCLTRWECQTPSLPPGKPKAAQEVVCRGSGTGTSSQLRPDSQAARRLSGSGRPAPRGPPTWAAARGSLSPDHTGQSASLPGPAHRCPLLCDTPDRLLSLGRPSLFATPQAFLGDAISLGGVPVHTVYQHFLTKGRLNFNLVKLVMSIAFIFGCSGPVWPPGLPSGCGARVSPWGGSSRGGTQAQ